MSSVNNKILIVDDEEMVRMNLEAFLEDEGFCVQSFITAEEALVSLMNFQPALAVVDIRLPGMDGANFIANASETMSSLKFIIHTGSLEFSLNEDLKRLGIVPDQILFKPLRDMNDLLLLANKLLN